MAFKFLQIGKANARIDELEAQLATITQERDQAKAALESNGAEISAAAEQLQTELNAVNNTITGLRASEAKAVKEAATAQAEVASLKEQLKAKDGEVKIKVAHQVQEEQAKLGQPSAPAVPASAKPAKEATGMARIVAAARADLQSGGYVPKR